MSIRVLFFSHSTAIAGAEISLIEAVEALTDGGDEVHVVVPGEGPLGERLVAAGASVTAVPHVKWVIEGRISWWQRLRSCLRLIRWSLNPIRHLILSIRRVRPHVVVTNTLVFPQGAIAAKLAGVPHIWYVHEFGREDQDLQFLLGESFSLRLMNVLSRRVVACSRAVAQKLSTYINVKKLRVVYYATDLRGPVCSADVSRSGRLRLLALGRLHPGKGQEDAVRAVAILIGKNKDVALSIVGADYHGYAAKLKAIIAELGVGHNVRLGAFSHEPNDQLSNCHVLLMCSRSEAFGRVTIEAMKAGRAVVATRAGANVELIRDGETGLLYEAGDAEALAEQIEHLYVDRTLLRVIGDRGRSWANNRFSLKRYGRDLSDVLTEAAPART